MNSEEIQQLVKIVEQSNIAEIEVSRWGKKVRISKFPNASGAQTAHYAIAPQMAAPPMPAPAANAAPPAASESAPAPAAAEKPAADGEEMKSPMVGTFYRSPAPDAEPYVRVGETVQKGQVLCIIEAMKLMNEVEAEYPCRILEMLVENGQPVEYNQPLFKIERV